MESAVGIIWRNIIKMEDDTDKYIAKILYNDYQNNVFRDIEDLSKVANVVPATITNFCKKNGFTGYRQLKERLKFEHERYINKKIENSELEVQNFPFQMYREIFNHFLDDLADDEAFIKKLKKVVFEKRELTVFVGAQLNSSVDFLITLLNQSNIFCKKVLMGETPFDDINKFIVNKQNPYLFVFTGEDNEMMYYLYESMIDKEFKNLFFITTTGQQERIKHVEDNLLVLRSKIKYFNSFYRKIITELLFLIIFDNK